MIENIINTWYTSQSFQTAMITILGGMSAGIAGWLLYRLPNNIVGWIKRQCTTSLVFNTASSSWSSFNQKQFVAFMDWFSKNNWFRYSRTITFETDGDKDGVGPGVGTHFFIYKGWPYWFTIVQQDSQGTTISKYGVNLSTVGRAHTRLRRVMEEFMVKIDRDNELSVYTATKEGTWDWCTYMQKRPLSSIFLPDDITAALTGRIDEWLGLRNWYLQRGLSYKLTYLLHGLPGTGKSSIIRAVASHYGRDLHIINLNTTGTNILAQLQRAKGGVVLIEDIDCYSTTHQRGGAKGHEEKKDELIAAPGGNVTGKLEELESPAAANDGLASLRDLCFDGGLSEMLNSLSGVVGLDDVIIFMTTNHIEKLDDALIRDDRVDERLEIPPMAPQEINKFYRAFYDTDDELRVDSAVPAATIQQIFLRNRRNRHTARKELEEAA